MWHVTARMAWHDRGHFECPCHLLQRLQRLHRRNGVAVLDARNVAAQQTRVLLNVALRQLLLLA